MGAHILLVEDTEATQENICAAVQKLGAQIQIKAVGSARRALEYLAIHDVDCVLLDYELPDATGLRLLHKIRGLRPAVPVILVTVHDDVDKVVEAMKLGAVHYVVKHGTYLPELQKRVRVALGDRDLQRVLAAANGVEPGVAAACDDFRVDGLIGSSTPLRAAIADAAKAARSRAAVLLQGDTGTGKELFARAIHYRGMRGTGPFVPVNCPAIPRHLIESELFGHVKGAFTDATDTRRGLFELADGGTIFFDEIGELDVSVQAKLLRVIEDGDVRPIGSERTRPVHVRIIAATNRDLRAACAQGLFREDLYFRLSGLRIVLPPLRERPTDIDPLFRHFLQRFGEDEGRLPGPVDREVLRLLERYAWPGNVRELRNEAYRIVAGIDPGQRVTAELLSAEIRGAEMTSDDEALKAVLSRVELAVIEERLRRHGYNVAAAARSLGITREWLWEKMRQLGIDVPRE